MASQTKPHIRLAHQVLNFTLVSLNKVVQASQEDLKGCSSNLNPVI
jgi:hypothetical protein